MKYIKKFSDISLKEAITDVPSKSYSDIFEPNGKIKKEVKSKIEEGIAIIKKNFLNLKIDDYYLVGAAVTFQYGDDSDIDTTVVVSPDTEKSYLHQVDKWVEKNLDAKFYHNKRPYQFKLNFKTRDNLDSADSAYDVKTDTWIKKPDYEKTMYMYNKKIGDTKSEENKIYYGFEKFVQVSLKKLQQSLIDNKSENDIVRNMKLAYSKYAEISKIDSEKLTADNQEGFIKKFRSSAYSKEIEPGYVSQNWGKGNVIYKMFDKEGYIQVFTILKDIIKNKAYGDEKLRQDLKTALEKVTVDEIGFKI
jgi:predicted nucleotidyltransferase